MITAILRDSRPFSFIPESDDKFLKLFPHRHDYIWAPHATHSAWQTESRHPLSDRLIKQGAYLYGVRFGAETNYCLLDIDKGSLYHPQRDPLAIDRILQALEAIGIVSYILCTSSYSGGLHLYIPFEQPQKTWELALAVKILLENAGFSLTQGHLEVFPNSKLYDADSPTLYKAHRLPLQSGSYLLNRQMEPCYTAHSTFVRQWETCQRRNDVNQKDLQQAIAQSQRRQYRLTVKASKFLNDLNADIEAGWTGHGQTNFILGRIAMRAYIFEHLDGSDLVNAVIATAVELPGYRDWCRHQHEIKDRAAHWARSVISSHYFPYGTSSPIPHPPSDMRNHQQQQSEDARERIRLAIASMLNTGTLPIGIKARFLALTQCGISGQTLYRHRDLWHPSDLSLSEENSQSMTSGGLCGEILNDCLEEIENCNNRGESGYKLIGAIRCNSSDTNGLSDRESDEMGEGAVTDATARVSDVSQCDLTAKEVADDTY